ncbi:MAG: GNAT family N-acetyltransferase [Actinomycetota bacterium]|nr:GNAT family N-acetyltransferase [Actinomycetota bacterium]
MGPEAPVAGRVLELAEDLNTHVPLSPGAERIVDVAFVIWLGTSSSEPSFTVVQRLRLEPSTVEPTVGRVRDLLDRRGRRSRTWEVGPSATPADLAGRLEALGMAPYREPLVVGMVLTEAPPEVAGVGARRAVTLADHIAAERILAEGFESEAPEEEIARQAELALQADRTGTRAVYLASVGGEPVAAAIAVFTDRGVVMSGGATQPAARGRGAYRALVAARWHDAAARGVPVLVTQAGSMSRPILRRLGFREVCEIWILLDESAGTSTAEGAQGPRDR